MVWLFMGGARCGQKKMVNTAADRASFTLPVVTDLLNMTNSWHGLVYHQLRMEALGPYQVLKLIPGPWYWVILVYCLIVLLAVAVQTRRR